jgi:hypothetical protein
MRSTAAASGGRGGSGRAAGVPAAVLAVLARPRLWRAALRQARALAPARWWRRPPFLPLPDRQWVRFRSTTAYGDPGAALDVEDLLTWLAWTDTVCTGPEPRHPASR